MNIKINKPYELEISVSENSATAKKLKASGMPGASVSINGAETVWTVIDATVRIKIIHEKK